MTLSSAFPQKLVGYVTVASGASIPRIETIGDSIRAEFGGRESKRGENGSFFALPRSEH